jgi:hypothetical protein
MGIMTSLKNRRKPGPKPKPKPDFKTCFRCGNTYPFTPEYFHRNAGQPHGLRCHCKDCSLKYKQRYNKDFHGLPFEKAVKVLSIFRGYLSREYGIDKNDYRGQLMICGVLYEFCPASIIQSALGGKL